MTHDYQPWTGELAVQPVPCPCCGSPAKVWQYVEKPGAEVLRVVMCDGGEMETDGLPVVIDACLLDMPPNAFYSATARQAVAVWNLYAESLNARRAAIAGSAQPPQAAPKADPAAPNVRDAAQAVLDRWDSPQWQWAKQGPTADLMAALRAALAAPAERGVQWQPIETAPNEMVLLAAEFDRPGDWRIKMGYRDDGPDSHHGWRIFGASWRPTHWMPLPDAPGATTKENAA